MLQVRGPKIVIYPTRNESLDSFWKNYQEIGSHRESLSELQISCVRLNDKMIDRLKDLHPKIAISTISLHSCTADPERLGSYLENLPLETLRLHGFTFQRKICLPRNEQCMLAMSLREVSFNGSFWDGVDNLVEFLQLCVSLERVSFKCCGLSDEALNQIVSALQTLPHLKYLDLAANRCGPKGMRSITALIKQSTTLEHLDLSYQTLTEGKRLCLESFLAPALLHDRSKQLKVLRLAGNLIDDNGISQLASSLRSPSCSLQHLDLSTNEISSNGLATLGLCLKTNYHLTRLNLKSNFFSDLSSLLPIIEENYSLEYLEHSCHASEPSAKFIAQICHLNRGGRRLLCQEPNIPMGLWSKVLARCVQTKNCDAIHYFLQTGNLVMSSA
eukprot:scaffold19_cov114-Cylindrotheca_fusiformis.AAC.32